MSIVEKQAELKYKSMIASAYLLRNVSYVFNYEEFVNAVEKSFMGNTIRIKWGIDPSADSMHIGHFVCLRKIKEIVSVLPCVEVCIIIGTATVLMHDPSGKTTINYLSGSRDNNTILNRTKKIKSDIATFLQGHNSVSYFHNHEWIAKIDIFTLLNLLRRIKVKDILQKFKVDNMSLSSAVYPAFQAYDSFHLNSDIEIGGVDQLTNVLLVRELAKFVHKKKQTAILMPLIHDASGQKMSKNSVLSLSVRKDNIDAMFGSIMSCSDSVFMQYLNLLSDRKYKINKLSDIEIAKRNFCMDLFAEIFSETRIEIEALLASVDKHTVGEQLPVVHMKCNDKKLTTVIAILLKVSNSTSRRLLCSNAIRVDGKIVSRNEIIQYNCVYHINVGKKQFKVMLIPS